jgi:chaperone modulatory protein CbpM
MTDENMPPAMPAGSSGEKPAEVSGTLLDEQSVLTLVEISSACAVQAGYVIELVEEGLITPVSPETGQEINPQLPREAQSWRFTGVHMRLVRIASRLQGDLGVNLAGVALALQLLDEVETLRTRLR